MWRVLDVQYELFRYEICLIWGCEMGFELIYRDLTRSWRSGRDDGGLNICSMYMYVRRGRGTLWCILRS